MGLGLEFCDVSVLQAQNKITGQSRQILFEGLPPQTQDLHGFFRHARIRCGDVHHLLDADLDFRPRHHVASRLGDVIEQSLGIPCVDSVCSE